MRLSHPLIGPLVQLPLSFVFLFLTWNLDIFLSLSLLLYLTYGIDYFILLQAFICHVDLNLSLLWMIVLTSMQIADLLIWFLPFINSAKFSCAVGFSLWHPLFGYLCHCLWQCLLSCNCFECMCLIVIWLAVFCVSLELLLLRQFTGEVISLYYVFLHAWNVIHDFYCLP